MGPYTIQGCEDGGAFVKAGRVCQGGARLSRRGAFVKAGRVCQGEARLSRRGAFVKAGRVCQGGARLSRRGAYKFKEKGRADLVALRRAC